MLWHAEYSTYKCNLGVLGARAKNRLGVAFDVHHLCELNRL